jgi:nicotinic acid mononucleotide adenylyltransferase
MDSFAKESSPTPSSTIEQDERRVAVFGGTFSPFCNHHSRVVDKVLEDGFAVVCVVPAFKAPFKDDVEEYTHRANMIELANEDRREKDKRGFAIVEVEKLLLKSSKTPIRTWQVLDWIADQLPDPVFVIGEDILPELKLWARINYIEETYGFHVVPDFGTHATDVRTRIKDHKLWEDFVSPQVAEYIRLHGLYGVHQ